MSLAAARLRAKNASSGGGGGGGGGSAYQTAVLADSPIVYLTLDDTSGTTAADLSGNGHSGTYTGSPTLAQTSLLPGGSGKSVLFTRASSQWVDLGNIAALNSITSAWTMEAWLKPSSNGNSGLGIITKTYDGSRVAFGLGFGLNNNGSTLQGGYYNGNWWAADGGAVTANTVYYAAVTWDSTILRLYVNGSQVGTATPSSGPTNSSETTWLGRRWDGSSTSNFYDGYLDEIAIYGSALSSTRIAAHYAAA